MKLAKRNGIKVAPAATAAERAGEPVLWSQKKESKAETEERFSWFYEYEPASKRPLGSLQ